MNGEWRSHPALADRFHPEAPDDVQVLVHDGGPLISPARAELVWVRVTSVSSDDVFHGVVLNRPEQLTTVWQGSEIQFVPAANDYLFMLTESYLVEREAWNVEPCSACGFDELFDPPSVLVAAAFANIKDGEVVEAFTTRCGLCGGTQVVALPGALDDPRPTEQPSRKRWWQFWR